MINKFKSILLAFILILPISLYGRHIVGGDVTYICIGSDNSDPAHPKVTFQVTLTMYRDCYQEGGVLSPFDDEATIGIHRMNDGRWMYERTLRPPLMDKNIKIPFDDNPCVEVPPNICVDRGNYIFNVTLELIDEPYLLSFQRCCRNNTVSNIIRPESTGAVIYVEISPEAQRTCNNSPSFNDFPPILICSGADFVFDHSATDIDGDQLVYEFCSPLQAGGRRETSPNACDGTTPNPAICRPPFRKVAFQLPTYTATTPVIGDPNLTINPNTGIITGNPSFTGQFVVGICVKEYRNGIQIGSINRDFQFNVTVCNPLVSAGIQSDASLGNKEFLLNSCGENAIEFINESVDENFIESYKWNFEVDGINQIHTTRDAIITFPGVGEYRGSMIVNEGTECADTASIYVNIYPDLDVDFSFAYDTCAPTPVQFMERSLPAQDNIVKKWEWDFAGQGNSVVRNPDFQFLEPGLLDVKLTITDNNECTAEKHKIVDWRPVPQVIVVEPNTFVGCNPASIFFNNLSEPIDETYDITWDFGDGEISKDISPTHIYKLPGTYNISVKIVSPIDCEISRTFNNLIRVESKPKADFVYSPESVNVFNNTIDFVDESIDAISWKWNFNDEGNSFEPNPSYTFQDTGVHFVELVVVHPSRCTDTLIRYIDVEPIANFFMPNAFTPNGDFKNDTFKGTGYISAFQNFRMTIWSRWGGVIFETDNPKEGWNGRKNNVGAELPTGVYVYLVEYLGPRGSSVELKGFATLVR